MDPVKKWTVLGLDCDLAEGLRQERERRLESRHSLDWVLAALAPTPLYSLASGVEPAWGGVGSVWSFGTGIATEQGEAGMWNFNTEEWLGLFLGRGQFTPHALLGVLPEGTLLQLNMYFDRSIDVFCFVA